MLAGRILIHGKKEIFIEAQGEGCRDIGGSQKEQEANRFAQDLLIPPGIYQAFINADLLTESAIQRFAKELGITPGIVVGRLQHDEVIPYSAAITLKKRFKFREETKREQGE